jgi:hypothetical protein
MQQAKSLLVQLVRWESLSDSQKEISLSHSEKEMWENLAGSLTTTTNS